MGVVGDFCLYIPPYFCLTLTLTLAPTLPMVASEAPAFPSVHELLCLDRPSASSQWPQPDHSPAAPDNLGGPWLPVDGKDKRSRR